MEWSITMSIYKQDFIYAKQNIFIRKYIEKQIVFDNGAMLIRYIGTAYNNQCIRYDITSIPNQLENICISIFCTDTTAICFQDFQQHSSVSRPICLFKKYIMEELPRYYTNQSLKELSISILEDAQKEIEEKTCLANGI